MKLTVDQGELTLPDGFSFEIEQNNAFFSPEGSQSIPATIPATPADQAKLGYPCRIGRKDRFVNAFPAILSHGAFEKVGKLIVSSADSESITCSLAVNESDFYATCKDLLLRDVFSAKILTTYSTPSDWYSWLFSVYKGDTDCDFRVFPVAVNYDPETGSVRLNNEPVATSGTAVWPLAHVARLVNEGGDEVNVPDGYGIAPYLKLWKFLEYIFTLNGYSVGRDCFRTDARLSGLVLLHNVSDVICNGRIAYSDLVPDKTVSDILEWMNEKFHAQVVVYPASKSVDIIQFENVLTTPPDDDLTRLALGKTRFTFSQARRVVMTPNTSLEGAQPAADTLQALVEKYGSVLECDETDFGSIDTPCLCLRLATGTFYEVHVGFRNSSRLGSIEYRKVAIGSNQIRYDRQNAEGAEEFSPEDVAAPMIVASGHIIAPYVGARSHRNTSYNGKEEKASQEIIIADYAGMSVAAGVSSWADGHYYYATTQAYDNVGRLRPGKIGLIPEDMIAAFFRGYNRIILNNAIEVTGEFLLSPADLMCFRMYAPKLFAGQLLLPKYLRYEVGRRTRCLELRSVLVKEFADGREDAPIAFPPPEFAWAINVSEFTARQEELQDMHDDGTVIYEFDPEDPYIRDNKDIFLPSPRAAGLESEHIDRLVHFILRKPQGAGHIDIGLESDTLPMWFDSVAIVS